MRDKYTEYKLSIVQLYSRFCLTLNLNPYFSLLMTDSQVLATAMRRRQDAHGNAAQDVCAYQLAYGLSLVPAVVHPHVLKCTFLRAKSGHLRKSNITLSNITLTFFR